MLNFDRLNLTLQIPGENVPRRLDCHYLDPEQDIESRGMNAEELHALFDVSGEQEEGADPQHEDLEENLDEENPEQMEAQNLIPPIANDAGDGLIDIGEGGIMEVDEVAMPAMSELDEPLEEEYVIDEEIVWSPPPKHQYLPDEGPPLLSSTASSSKASAEGSFVTPEHVRAMIPARVGAKIQHRTYKSGSSAGWQAWISPSTPSRWFSYGALSSAHATKQAALDAAIAWLWSMDAVSNA